MGNVFNRYGAGGKSEGLYLWKKSEIIPPITVINPSFTFDSTGVSKTLNLSNFDFTQIDNYIDFFDGFTDGGNAYFYVTNSALYYHTGSTNHSILTFNATNSSTATMTGGSFTSTKVLHFDGAKILQQAKVGNFIGYVISDKEDAYPDKEAKDGFYYERVVLSPSAFGCTRYEVGKIHNAMASNSLVVNHSLGELPKIAYLWQTDMSTGLSAGVYAFNPNATNEIHWATLAGDYISPYSGTTSAYEENDKKVIFLGYTTSSAKFTVADYHYILFA